MAQPQDSAASSSDALSLSEIVEAHRRLTPYVRRTPVLEDAAPWLGTGTRANFKFELLQRSGTFKVRGAFAHLLGLSNEQRKRGVTCVSAGNHAVAVAHAAHALEVPAITVMLRSASPARVQLCESYGAQVLFADDGEQAFDMVDRLQQEQGLYFVHPFSSESTVLGTATLGWEWMAQSPDLDAVLVPIGGGGLAAGVATAVAAMMPQCRVYGVEPEGAAVMSRSLAAGKPTRLSGMHSIADSLMAPHTEVYSFNLCQTHLHKVVTVSDEQLRSAMLYLFQTLKLAVEPACAAATAAAMYPLRQELQGARVGLLLCGSNIDPSTFMTHLQAAAS